MSKKKNSKENNESKIHEKKNTSVVVMKKDDSLKPSTSKGIALIDNLVQSQKKAIPERKKQSESATYAAKSIGSLAPKNFVVKKKKTKKLSAMKRRILNVSTKLLAVFQVWLTCSYRSD
jgi:hypothetical protein